MRGFIEFIRKQGVVGLAVGFILGGAVSRVVSAIVNDLVNPIIAILLGSTKALESFVWKVDSVEIRIGHFLTVIIDFVVIALVVYVSVHLLKLDRLDRKEEKKEEKKKA